MAMQAQETFVAELGDGSSKRVVRGEVLPDGHELVKRDRDGSGTLFKPLDLGEEETAAPVKAPSKPAAVSRPVTRGNPR